MPLKSGFKEGMLAAMMPTSSSMLANAALVRGGQKAVPWIARSSTNVKIKANLQAANLKTLVAIGYQILLDWAWAFITHNILSVELANAI